MHNNGTSPRLIDRHIGWAVLIAVIALYLFIAVSFASVQDLWTDETTQLAGSALPLGRMMRWLAGGTPIGVPGDRMPPLSYLVDALCWRTWCTRPMHFRLLHLTATAIGIAVVLRIVLRRYGIAPMVIVGLFLALSSTLVNEAIEIRSYPLFFAATCLQLAVVDRAFVRGHLSPSVAAAFALASAVSIHLHFFGLVASCALSVALAAGLVRTRRDVVLGAAIAAVILVAAVALAPFVMGANTISAPIDPGEGSSVAAIGRYLLRLIGFATMLIYPVAALLFFGGFAMLIGLVLTRAVPTEAAAVRAAWPFERALTLALLAGLAVTIAASFVMQGFYPLKAPYSLWTLPVVAVLLGGACDGRGRPAWQRWSAALGAAMLIAGSLISQWALIAHARWFTHGTMREIVGEFVAPPQRVAILYAGSNWPSAYFSLLYRYGRLLEQRQIDDKGRAFRIEPGGDVALTGLPFEPGRFDQVLVVALGNATFHDLRALRHGRAAPELQAMPTPPPQLAGWSVARRVSVPGFFWLRMIDLRRTDVDHQGGKRAP